MTFQTFQQFLAEHQVLSQFGLTRLGVFGSFARGEAFQDIDLLIDEDIEYKQLLLLQRYLEKNLHVKIDVMLHKYAEPIVLKYAQQDLKYVSA